MEKSSASRSGFPRLANVIAMGGVPRASGIALDDCVRTWVMSGGFSEREEGDCEDSSESGRSGAEETLGSVNVVNEVAKGGTAS